MRVEFTAGLARRGGRGSGRLAELRVLLAVSIGEGAVFETGAGLFLAHWLAIELVRDDNGTRDGDDLSLWLALSMTMAVAVVRRGRDGPSRSKGENNRREPHCLLLGDVSMNKHTNLIFFFEVSTRQAQ